MSKITLESQLIEIIKNKEMADHIKHAKIDMLIRLGVDVNVMCGAKSALMFANDKSERKIAELLKDNGAKEFLDEGEARNLGEKLGAKCHNGGGDIDEVKELIDQGAEIDVVYEGGPIFTSLIWASGNGYTDVVEYLIEKGANINQKMREDVTPLMWACVKEQIDIMELLIKKGADINVKDEEGDTPLMHASNYGYMDIVEMLVEKGANVNEVTNGKRTALMKAVMNEHYEIAEYLIANGAHVNAKDSDGKTALMFAEDEKMKKTIISGVKKRNEKMGENTVVQGFER